MPRTITRLLTAVSLVCMAGSAQATVITEDVTFSASSFFGFYYGDPVPTSPVTGSFALSFDPTSASAQFGAASNFLNITAGPSGFNYDPSSGQATTIPGSGIFPERMMSCWEFRDCFSTLPAMLSAPPRVRSLCIPPPARVTCSNLK